jgi:hypothetical protein
MSGYRYEFTVGCSSAYTHTHGRTHDLLHDRQTHTCSLVPFSLILLRHNFQPFALSEAQPN